MKTPLSRLATSVGFSWLLLSTAIARPVTSADLSGKTICWDDGTKETYQPGGKTSQTFWGEGTWRVTSVGVEKRGKIYMNIWAVQILGDGTLTAAADFSGVGVYRTGHYCNKP